MSQRKANLLIVDDHPENLTALEAVLAGTCDELVKATSGSDALRHLLKDDFALILMDAEMPRMNGFETARIIRSRQKSRYTPIIFLTAVNKQDKYVSEGYSAGAVDYLLKPIMPDILRSKVVAFVDQFRKSEEVKEQAAQLAALNRELEAANLRMKQLYDELAAANAQLATERDFVSKVLHSAGSLVMILDGEGRVVRFNRACEQTSGYSFDDVQGEALWDRFFSAQESELAQRSFAAARQSASPAEFESTCTPRNGTARRIAWCFTPLGGSGPLADYVVATGMDVTERIKAEEARTEMIREQTARLEAEAAQRRFAFLAEASASLLSSLEEKEILSKAVWLAVPEVADWCLIYSRRGADPLVPVEVAHTDADTARAARVLLARTPQIGDDHPVSRAFRSARPECIAGIAAVAGEGDHRSLLEQLGLESACVVPIVARSRVLGVMVFGASCDGRSLGPAEVSMTEHLAHRVALAIENANLYFKAQEASNAKDQFLATISHELRTPLNAMLGWARLLRAGKLDAAGTVRAMETIERNARAQAQLVEDILDISRIVVGKLRLSFQETGFASVVEAAIDTARPTADIKGIRLEADIEGGSEVIMGDPDRLQQVVWNVLSNAIKFTPPGGRVSVTLRRVDGSIQLKIGDTGVGISADFLPHIFDRFSQAESSSSRTHGGLGLGLSIVRHLVELHGGAVSAESAGVGVGATFTISLPLRAAAAAPAAGDTGDNREMPGSEEALFGLHVLAIENQAEGIESLTMLRRYGADVVTVGTADEAIEAMHCSRPDVLIVDLHLTPEDGRGILARLREEATGPAGIPAIAVTAESPELARDRILQAGFQVCLSRPLVLMRAVESVAALCGRARLAAQGGS